MSIKKLLPMSALTIAVAATFSVPVYAEDFIDDGTHIIDLAIALPKATPVVKATHHSFIGQGNEKDPVAYFEGNHHLQNGDSIYLERYGSRFVLDKWSSDLSLSSITVTDVVHTSSPGMHSGWIGIFAREGEGIKNQNITFNQVNLGKNTAFQLHGDVAEGLVYVGEMNITNDIPQDGKPEAYDPVKNAAQIEAWGGDSWGKYDGKNSVALSIGRLVVQEGQSVAFSMRNNPQEGGYANGTKLNIGEISLAEGASVRSGYSCGANGNPTGEAWTSTSIETVNVHGDSKITVDNGTFDISNINVDDSRTLSIVTNKDSEVSASSVAAVQGNLNVNLGKDSNLAFDAKLTEQSSIAVSTLASAPGTVNLGNNATVKSDDITVTGLSQGATGNIEKDLKALALVVQKDGKGIAGVELSQEATDIFDGGSAITTANGGLSQVKVTANSNINGIAEMTAVGLHIWRNEINDMNKRLGELRDSSDDANGVWARVYNGKAKFGDQKITNKYTAFQFGYDRQVADGLWLGGAMSWTDGDSDFAVGGGDNALMALTAYGSKLWDNGMFVDVTGKFGRIKNEFDIRLANGRSSADYDANAVSVSAEAGWRVYPLNNGFFVEPQVEMMYGRVESVDYTTSTGVKVNQDFAETLIGRVGFVMGLKCPADRGNAYVRASVLHDWEGDANFKFSKDGVNSRAISESLGGTWYEYGIGANFNATKQLHIYADVEAANGGEVDTDYRVNLGMRYSF